MRTLYRWVGGPWGEGHKQAVAGAPETEFSCFALSKVSASTCITFRIKRRVKFVSVRRNDQLAEASQEATVLLAWGPQQVGKTLPSRNKSGLRKLGHGR